MAAVPIFVDEILVRWGGRVMEEPAFRALPETFRTRSLQIDWHSYLVPFEITEADYFNHSCDPNAGLQGPRTLVAMRPIKKGEVIAYDYAMSDSSNYDEFPCACGSPQCRQRVTGEDWKRPDLQAKYRGFFSPYLAQKIG